ncbi:MAG: 2Fe-2S iron-sulfur cluster binding domain-containing protein [Chitinivibrionales bacterium]|nr:2Fe-2S iron-sulfur cluster binding domain-containing protein [Chitinivibrionales bacterium]
MSDTLTFTIDGKECTARPGQNIVDAAKENGVYIPILCHFEGLTPAGTCRICTVKVNGKCMAACTTEVAEGMAVENETPEINDMRKVILEMLLVEGNHFCPACEKSGDCELQAMAYRYKIMAPRFKFTFKPRKLDASNSKLILERNRCIFCKRCIRGVLTEDGKHVFAFTKRGSEIDINIDKELAAKITDEMAQEAMDMCPVGSIIRKEQGFAKPIGARKYDSKPIGSDVESKAVNK